MQDLLNKSKIFKKWDASLLLQVETSFIGKKIKGKLMYFYEEETDKIKKKMVNSFIAREYLIRQNRHSIHQKPIKRSHNNAFNSNPS